MQRTKPKPEIPVRPSGVIEQFGPNTEQNPNSLSEKVQPQQDFSGLLSSLEIPESNAVTGSEQNNLKSTEFGGNNNIKIDNEKV